MGEFDQFLSAISGQESGGNYSAVNARTGASGRWQIMPANIGPWSQKYLGRTVGLAEFRSNAVVQDQLAKAVLQDYYNRYGWRGAASAWYSGNPNAHTSYRKFRSNEPSIGEYVDAIGRRMGNSAPADIASMIQMPAIDNRVQQSAYEPEQAGGLTKALGLGSVDESGLGIEAGEGFGSSMGKPIPSGIPRPSSDSPTSVEEDIAGPRSPGAVSGDITTRVRRDNGWIDAAMNSALNIAQGKSGVPIRVTQGSWSNRVAASAGTHTGTQVADLVVSNGRWEEAVNALRAQGYAAWFRNWPGNLHIHVVGPGATGKAAAQYQDYLRGGDGLA